ncbi:MAG: NAD-dependent epimerase/dehydratase family protein, partial [Leptospirales bacterium]
MSGYLVTGGAGFIGSHLVRALVGQGKTVKVLDNFSTGKESNLETVSSSINVIRGDVRSLEDVERALSGVRYVFHQAAVGSVPRSIADPFDTQTANVNGTLNLLWKAREMGVRRVVIAGSSSVYGDTPGMP